MKLQPLAARRLVGTLVCLGAIQTAVIGAPSSGPMPGPAKSALARQLPVSFEANRGQFDARVRFRARTSTGTVWLTPTETVLVLGGASTEPRPGSLPTASRSFARTPVSVLRMRLKGSNARVRVTGGDRLPGVANYLIGRDPSRWRTQVPTFGRVTYTDLYPGIDLVYYGKGGGRGRQQLEYDFVLRPNADPSRIRVALEGARSVRVDAATGNLVASTAAGDVVWKRPYAYQVVGGKRTQVAVAYDVISPSGAQPRTVAMRVGGYDRSRPLVLDPVLDFGTYLGGSNQDSAYGVGVDSAGCVYIGGTAMSTDFPVVGGFGTLTGLYGDAFVAKLDPANSSVVYSTYIGGSLAEASTGIAVTPGGSVAVFGFTGSADFPLANAAQATMASDQDAFVARLQPDGSGLVYSTYHGGTAFDGFLAGQFDEAGQLWACGYTLSSDVPVTGDALYASGAGTAGFLTRFSATGSRTFSTYLFTSGVIPRALAVGATTFSQLPGHVYVTGSIISQGFHASGNAYQRTFAGGPDDGFVLFLDHTETSPAIEYSSYLGGNGSDILQAVAVDASGNVHVAGYGTSTDLPITTGALTGSSKQGGTDGMLGTFTAAGDLSFCAYLGGNMDDTLTGIGVDPFGYTHLCGFSESDNLPTTTNMSPRNRTGFKNGYYMRLRESSATVSCSGYIAGDEASELEALAIADDLNIYLAGWSWTYSGSTAAPFPTPNGMYHTNRGQVNSVLGRVRYRDLTKLECDTAYGIPGGTATLSAKLTRSDTATPIAGKVVTFEATINGTIYSASGTTNGAGIATAMLSLPSDAPFGSQRLLARFSDVGPAGSGDPEYCACTAAGVLWVQKPSLLSGWPSEAIIGSSTALDAELLEFGTMAPISGRTVLFTIDGVAAASGSTNASGFASASYTVPATMTAGIHTLVAKFPGDTEYGASATSTTLIARHATTLAVTNSSGPIGGTSSLRATLKKKTGGAAVVGATVNFRVDGVAVGSGTTNASGVATCSYAVPTSMAATAVVEATFSATTEYAASSGTGTLTRSLAPTAVVLYAPNAVAAGAYLRVYAYLKRTTDNAMLSGRLVTFTVNGLAAGGAITDINGYCEIWYKTLGTTPAGSIPVTGSYSGDDRHASSTKSINATIYTGILTSMSGNSPTGAIGTRVVLYAYLFQTLPLSPKVMVSGKLVTFTVDGVKVGTGTTDSNGYAYYRWQVPAGTASGAHPITSTFLGDTGYGGATRNGTLTVSALYGTTLSTASKQGVRGLPVTFYCYLYRSLDNMLLPGRSVTFQVDGVDVGTSITDTNGYATFVYAVPAGATVGSHPFKVLFAGDLDYAAGSVASTLTVAAKDNVVWSMPNFTGARGSRVTVYAYLKSATTGGLLAGKTVSFKLDGTAVGSAVTNSSGYISATFIVPITAPSGAHTILAEFAGDATTNASSKTSTFTVP